MDNYETSNGPEDLSDKRAEYQRLVSRKNLGGLDNSEALEHLGKLIDFSLDLGQREGLEKAVILASELQSRHLSDEHWVISQYFLSNVWADLRALSGRNWEEWEQPELGRQLLHERMAVKGQGLHNLHKHRIAQIFTNMGNALSEVGRPVEAIEHWEQALSAVQAFPMALGNRGYGLYRYASYIHDSGHRNLMMKAAHANVQEATSPESEPYIEGNAAEAFQWVKEQIENRLPSEYLAKAFDLNDYDIGDSEEEISYRQWCLSHRLFLNPLNDLGPYKVAGADTMILPSIVTHLRTGPNGPALLGLYNAMKQEFVAARYLYYEGTNSTDVHYSDKEVKLYDTLDYPVHSLAVEKVKAAFRTTYSITDRIAFFLKHYLHLSVREDQVSYRKVWYQDGKRNNGLDPGIEIAQSWPLRGLFWVSQDFHEDDPEWQDALEPEAQDIRTLRHAIEHRYLKLSWVHYSAPRDRIGPTQYKDRALDDNLAIIRNVSDLEDKTLRMLKTVRAALIYLCLAVDREEYRRQEERGSEPPPPFIGPYFIDDEWKS